MKALKFSPSFVHNFIFFLLSLHPAIIRSQFLSEEGIFLDQPIPISFQTVRDQIEQQFGSNVGNVNTFNIANHAQLQAYTLVDSKSIQAKFGIINSLYYSDKESTIRVTTITNCYGQIQQLIYGPMLANIDDPVLLIELLKRQVEEIDTFKLFTVTSNTTTLYFDFFDTNYSVVQIVLKRDKLGNLSQSYRLKFLQLNHLVFPDVEAKLNKYYPQFSKQRLKRIKYYLGTGFIVFLFRTFSISTQLVDCQFIINEPVLLSSYNYNEDQKFFQVYTAVQKKAPIANLPPIGKVSKNNTKYQIQFESAQFPTDIDIKIGVVATSGQPTIQSIEIDQNVEQIINTAQNLNEVINQQISIEIDANFVYYVDSEIPEIENCKIISQDKCVQCQDGFVVMADGQCTKKVDNCEEYLENKCLRCIENYSLVLIDRETVCVTGFVVPNCAYYLPFIRVCIKCQERYFLDVSLNKCNPISKLCQRFDSDTGRCFQCTKDYTLSREGQCYQSSIIIPNCETQSEGICQKCAQQLTLVDNYCLNPRQGCSEFNSIQQTCLKCSENFIRRRINSMLSICEQIVL